MSVAHSLNRNPLTHQAPAAYPTWAHHVLAPNLTQSELTVLVEIVFRCRDLGPPRTT
jgi:hypothetical protein